MNIMWFRRDLRLHDNPAFYHAVRSGPTVAVYGLCDEQWDNHGTAPIQRSMIIAQLLQLEKDLAKLSIPLVVLNGRRFSNLTDILVNYLTEIHAQNLFFNEEYEVNEMALTSQIMEKSLSVGIQVHKYHDQCLIAPGGITNKQNLPYQVFTAFKKAYLAELSNNMRALYARPNKNPEQYAIDIQSDLTELEKLQYDTFDSVDLPIGESLAHEQLESFCQQFMVNYKADRDFPAIEGTSKLSAYLAIGMLSVRQCWHCADYYRHEYGARVEDGANTWMSELIWRDFYRHLLFFYPNLCKGEAFKPKTEMLNWNDQSSAYEAWKRGQTGYPIVDAAMRQLNETGWMHNRLRMVVAMFLTKHLFVDWRLGERYFMEKLVDGDFASNNGGWQWSASTGVDAAPYFRIFNPTRQSERFDPEGLFLRQYLPELRSLDNKSIHMPSAEQAKALGYPEPIVDHSSAVQSTKEKFKALDQMNNPNEGNGRTKGTKQINTNYVGELS